MLIYIFTILFFATSLKAQMCSPSLFPEIKSQNPAVITKRKVGNIRLSALSNNIKKNLSMTTMNGTAYIAEESSKTSYIDTEFFKGGKGGGLTSELLIDNTNGDQTTTFTPSGGASQSNEKKVSATYIGYAFSFANLGIGINFANFSNKYSANFSSGSETVNKSTDMKITMLGAKPGIVFGGNGLSLGFTLDIAMVKSDIVITPRNSRDATGMTAVSKMIGFGIGFSGTNSNFELSLEIDPISSPEAQPGLPTPAKPMKLSLLLEKKLGGLTLGYKGTLYKGGVSEYEKIAANQLAYSNPGDSSRINHAINFSLGSSNGLSFGASGGYSSGTKKEGSSIFVTTETYDTKVTELSLQAKVSYNY